MNIRLRRAAAGLALLLALSLTACGSSSETQTEASAAASAAETATAEATVDPSLKGLARKGTGSAQSSSTEDGAVSAGVAAASESSASGSTAPESSVSESSASGSTASESSVSGSSASESTEESSAVSADNWRPTHQASEFQPEDTAISMRIALAESADSVVGKTCQKFADLLDSYSGGTITAEIYPDGELFSREEIGMAVSDGYVQAAAGTPGIAMSETLAIFQMANVFSSMDYAHSVCDKSSDFRSLISGIMENSGVQMLGMEPREYEVVSSSRAVRSAAEITGLHLALTEPDLVETYWKQWGADVTETTQSDLYFCMQSGATEAQVSTIQGIFDSGIESMQDYVINTHSHLLFTVLMMNNDFYESLSDNARGIVDAAAEDAMSYSYTDALATAAADRERVQQAGMEYIDFTSSDIKTLRANSSEADAEVCALLGENTYGRLMAALGY